jgi:dihydrodipicolinate reductase
VTAASLNNKQLQQQQQQWSQQKQLVVTSSGFKGAAKNQIKQLAADLGALYSGELVRGLTTHLVGVQ